MTPKTWLRRQLKQEEEAAEDEPLAREDAARKHETERERQLHGLAVLSLFMHTSASIEEMMAKLLEQAPVVTGATFVYPLLLERKRQVLRASVLEGITDQHLEAAMDAFQEDLTALEFPLLQNAELYRVLNDGEVVVRDGFAGLMKGVLDDEQWKAGEQTLAMTKLALAPMVVENEPLGIVVFGYDDGEAEIETLELLVGHLTLALRDLLVRDEAVRFSDVDPVTWVYNRRHLKQSLQAEIMRAGRYGRGLSLILLDVDDFGQFNADYGQSMGDRLLRIVATTLAESVIPPELVARVRDDTFAILLPETNRATAVTTTTRLLAGLSQASVFSQEDEAAPPITCSVAIACFPEDGATPQQLIDRALTDLELAKREREREQARGRLQASAGG